MAAPLADSVATKPWVYGAVQGWLLSAQANTVTSLGVQLSPDQPVLCSSKWSMAVSPQPWVSSLRACSCVSDSS